MQIRFISVEDGVKYLITNYRRIKGEIRYSTGKCWKFPLK